MGNVLRKLGTIWHFLPWIHKTIYFNFHYLPFSQAVKLPILLYKPHFIKLKGKVIIQGDKVRSGMIIMGILNNTCNPNNGISFDLDGTLVFKGPAVFSNDSYIMIRNNGSIVLGANLDANCKLKCANSIEIGDNTVIAYETMIMDSDWHALTDMVTGKLLKKTTFVKIGSYNFISYRCIITKGTITPDYCTVLACSHLSKKYDVPQYSLIGGDPCKFIDEGFYMDPNNN